MEFIRLRRGNVTFVYHRVSCVNCNVKTEISSLRVAPCGHYYCQSCLKELPDDYVSEVLTGPGDYAKYQKLAMEKDWKMSDLEPDAEYTATVKALGAKQCPGCGIGVQRDFGCVHMTCPNGHQFCFTCLRLWGSCNCPLIPEDELQEILGE